MHLKWALAITGLGLALGLALAQQPQDIPTINVSVNVVNILCSVRDSKGALLPNLTKDDFTVTEEGKPQDIRYFTHETDLPLTLGLLVDVSGSERNMIEIEKRAADQFFGKVLRKQDMAFLMSFGSEAELLQDSTNSVVLLRRGLDNLKLRTGATGPLPGPVPTINQPRGTILFDAVYLAATEQLRSGSRPQGDRAHHRRRRSGQPRETDGGHRGRAEVGPDHLQHPLLRSEFLPRSGNHVLAR